MTSAGGLADSAGSRENDRNDRGGGTMEKVPFRLFLIRVGNHLVALSIAGAILALWR